MPYIAGIDEAKGENGLFGQCVILQILEFGNGKDQLQGIIAILDLACDCVFVIDLILNFNTARWQISTEGREHWVIIEDLKTIRTMYLWQSNSLGVATWWPGAFYLDLMGVIPWQYIDCFGASASLKYLRLLRLIKLTRLYRIRRLIEGLHYKFPSSVFAITSMQLILTMFLFAHWLCCIWYRVGSTPSMDGWVHSPNANLMDEHGEPLRQGQEYYEWVTALYWAITTMTTIGYGDISATTAEERAVACVVMILGCGFFAWSTGTITSVLTTKAACKVRFTDKLEELTEFMNARDLPPDLREMIRGFYMLKFPTMKIFDEELIINDMPTALGKQVRVALHQDVVQKCPLFQTMHSSVQQQICLRLFSLYQTEGIQITSEGEYPDAMYMVRFGIVEILVRGEVVSELTTGDLFGENALLGLTSDGKRNRSSMAKTMCEVCALSQKDLMELLKLDLFRQPLSTMIHHHISNLDKGVATGVSVSAASRYCINWGHLAKKHTVKIQLQKQHDDDHETDSHLDRDAPVAGKMMPVLQENDARVAGSQTGTQKSTSSPRKALAGRGKKRLRSQLTIMMKSIRLSLTDKHSKRDQTDLVMAFYWRGDQSVGFRKPTLLWSDPFNINLGEDCTERPHESRSIAVADENTIELHLSTVQVMTLQHYHVDWKDSPPLRIMLFQVLQDPVHFIPPVSLPELRGSPEALEVESRAGLKFVAGGSMPLHDLVELRKPTVFGLKGRRSGGTSGETLAQSILNRQGDDQIQMKLNSVQAGIDTWPSSTLTFEVSMHRLLPRSSLWRGLIEIMKRRGASDYFKMRQRDAIARMRVGFDQIMEAATTLGRRSNGYSGQAQMTDILNSVNTLASSVQALDSRMHTMGELREVLSLVWVSCLVYTAGYQFAWAYRYLLHTLHSLMEHAQSTNSRNKTKHSRTWMPLCAAVPAGAGLCERALPTCRPRRILSKVLRPPCYLRHLVMNQWRVCWYGIKLMQASVTITFRDMSVSYAAMPPMQQCSTVSCACTVRAEMQARPSKSKQLVCADCVFTLRKNHVCKALRATLDN